MSITTKEKFIALSKQCGVAQTATLYDLLGSIAESYEHVKTQRDKFEKELQEIRAEQTHRMPFGWVQQTYFI